MPATTAHFNGSVNLADAETVMREIGARIPHAALTRITEGETGERIDWTRFQRDLLAATGQFVNVPIPEDAQGDYARIQRVGLAAGVDPAAIEWPDLGYATAYIESFATFEKLRADGVLPAHARMQLQYPTPLAGLSFVDPADIPAVLGSYTAALHADLARALAALPHDRIAIQFDVAVEIGLLVGNDGNSDAVAPMLLAGFAQVPADVPTGAHLCYGDLGHKHFLEPDSLALQIGLINHLTAAAPRTIDWFSLTVPQNRSDEPYFAPLAELAAPAATQLAFGIVPYHPADQAAGTTADQIRWIDTHLAASAAGARDWAIGTECGMGRARREDVPTLLDTYAEILTGRR